MIWGWRVRWAWTSSRALWLLHSRDNQRNKQKKKNEEHFIYFPNIGPAADLWWTLKKTKEVDFIPPIETFGFILNNYLASLRLWLIKPILAFNILMEPNLTEPNLTWTNFI